MNFLQSHIQNQIAEHGLENDQIKIDFAGLNEQQDDMTYLHLMQLVDSQS